MFRRIRFQLTLRNAAVLSVILVALNVSVYVFTQQMLFARIDRSLDLAGERAFVGTNAVSVEPIGEMRRPQNVVYSVNRMDRPLFVLYWTAEEELLSGRLAGELEADPEALRPSAIGDSPRTVKVGEQYYRVRNVPIDQERQALPFPGVEGADARIATCQLLTNISAEVGMLKRLAYVLLIGGFAGLLFAVAAGYYLANRALIPIRIAMEKQQQFVSDASHELRTPLAVIQAHAELMLRHPERTIEQDSKSISTVLQEARRMSKLVAGLLTLARSDSRGQELDVRPVLFDRIVRDCVRKMQMLAEVKAIAVRSELEQPLPMQADEERLHQLLTIVLDNAIRYTPEGGQIRVACRKLSHTVQLEVLDTGVGIAPEHLPRVFDRFYRGDKARSRRDGGAGLGLAIAKWIVDSHGGKIRVDSKPGAGTLVTVAFPV